MVKVFGKNLKVMKQLFLSAPSDTGTSNDVRRIQQSLISHQTCGINNSYTRQINGEAQPSNGNSRESHQRAWVRNSLPLNDPLAATCMPESWARASILIRLNLLAGVASGIRVSIAESSGDRSALAWMSALMECKLSAMAFTDPRDIDGARKVTRANTALSEADIEPISLQAKERLAIMNGTALAALSDESFKPFITQVRPHSGQPDEATLWQDRYSWRTASQWIGPVLEDFALAYDQLTVELNLARAVRSAVEKLCQGLQSIGRMLFTQCTEMMNPATNRGLPPTSCPDDSNISFLFKGMNILTAEMDNQALNSLALLSARYTLEGVDILSQIAAAHLLALCQAFDPRAIEIDGRTSSRRMYYFIRNDLGTPFLGEEHLDSAKGVTMDGISSSLELYNTRVYEPIRLRRLYDIILNSFKEAKEMGQRATVSGKENCNGNGTRHA
ncbi:L-Aspartase-like protein [Xylaria bambusicola]|uniref:L-Aspartase-like protein n=1 Tax=Xylaria bambusicola TaxID=326684 RepID=UPI002007A787|nr:L-Aspartase-like protein [Xylaria bambusicola]KAI0522312.1 L-Aspartase-like protein [Xylaria bambusicola]